MNDYKNNWFYKMCMGHLVIHFVAFVIGIFVTIAGVKSLLTTVTKLGSAITLLGAVLLAFGGIAIFSLYPKLKKVMKELSEYDLNSLGTRSPEKMYYDTFYVTDRFLCAPAYFALLRYDKIKNVSVLKMPCPRSNDYTYYLRVFMDDNSKVEIRIEDSVSFLAEQRKFMCMLEEKKNLTHSEH
ncbi:hypothetical protein [Ruminococcus albus]|uniref:Uncharacterized protein n=1 Tax=Ruminococcus albus TaxID=1264 RepID=A0A1I1FEE6_RUMAL|nr:hypothetical protein [Ruminococcus albus]SFB96068.1 hypothetical protein SAMN02910406_00913 [Ruminococcus albus]